MKTSEQDIYSSMTPEGQRLLREVLQLENANLLLGVPAKESAQSIHDLVKGFFQ